MVANALTPETIANMARAHLRISASPAISNLATDKSTDGKLAALFYGTAVKSILESFDWSFARKTVKLTVADDGTDEPWHDAGDWAFAYDVPSDLVVGRYFSLGQRGKATHPPEWTAGVHDGQRVIYANVAEECAYFVYTFENDAPSLWPEIFGRAVSYALAAQMAGPLSVDESLRRTIAQEYAFHIDQAMRIDANNAFGGEPPTSELIEARY